MSHPLYIAFIWHMHQPYYRDLASGACSMPWVRLHATKDYLDMVKRLEAVPAIHQTFNIVPSLIDQLEEYLPPANRSDAFLELSRKPAAQLSEQEQRFLLRWFFLAHGERMIRPHPRYHDLLAKRGLHVSDNDWPMIQKRFRTQDYLDLQVWFNLVWIDPWLRRQDAQLVKLEEKGSHFTEAEKSYLLDQHLAIMGHVIPAYREAAARGQVELTTSPYYHPIMPLLCDTHAALMALPRLPLPQTAFRHPDDARWHLQQGLVRHHAAFGRPARGVWPSEGSVSEEFLKLAIESGVGWIATDEEILWRTLKTSRAPAALYRPHLVRRKGGQLAVVFRDRELSDLIGFVYSQWDAAIAVADFLKRLGEIHQQFRSSARPALVSIILDGENAWEFYPQDGHEFLTALYGALAQDARFRCVTVSEFLEQHPPETAESLPELFSGSWIDGNFATWIGHPEKNAAWGHLANARHALGPFVQDDLPRAGAWKSLGAAEGSDWMWWFGDTHYSAQAEEFDRLFRLHLSNAYHLAGHPVPAELTAPIRRPVVPARQGPTGLIHPTIDGRETSYYEWLYAGRLELKEHTAAIQRGEQCLERIYYGFDETHQYLRVDLDPARLDRISSWVIELALSHGVRIRVVREAAHVRARLLSPGSALLPCALERILEVGIPRDVLGLKAGEKLELTVILSRAEDPLERYPTEGVFELMASSEELAAQSWSV